MTLNQTEIKIVCNALFNLMQKAETDAKYYASVDVPDADNAITAYAAEIRDLYLKMCAEIEED